MHEYYEIPLQLLFTLGTEHFLELCSRYLTDALADEYESMMAYEYWERRGQGWRWLLGL